MSPHRSESCALKGLNGQLRAPIESELAQLRRENMELQAACVAKDAALLEWKRTWYETECEYPCSHRLAEKALALQPPDALKDVREALQKCVCDIEFWSEILDKEWRGFDGQLNSALNAARKALACITP